MAIQYYSTKNRKLTASLKDAVIQGQAADGGLFLPDTIPLLTTEFISGMEDFSFREISYHVASSFLKNEVPEKVVREIVDHTVAFDAPLVKVSDGIYALELFHGPTMAFKDFGARFMSQLLGYFAVGRQRQITILAATSGDTGSAVANGFLGVEGVRVVVLYPAGKVSDIQEKQFTTLGQNITALEVDGTFDDCQRLVKTAFADEGLCREHFLTSANSINIARLIPQSFYYFYAWSRLKEQDKPIVFSVPSGNFGNLTAGVLAMRMGLPVHHFVASTNVNDCVPKFLNGGHFEPRPSVQTISNAMDVGNPSNFARLHELFGGARDRMRQVISGYSFSDTETAHIMLQLFRDRGYLLDPHGAVALLGLQKYLSREGSATGIFLETAHPAKFRGVVEEAIQATIEVPETLQHFLNRKKQAIRIDSEYESFRDLLKTFL